MTLGSSQNLSPPFRGNMPAACWLDRLADFELQLGHHVRAEQLAREAERLREVAR